MTTLRVPYYGFVIAVALTLLASFLPLSATAEENENSLASTSEAVLASTTPETVTPEPEKPWYFVEQLSGDNLALGDFVVGPGKIEIEVKPGETVVTEISLANRISDNRTFELSVEDIEGSTDASQSVRLLGEAKGPYTLKDYISFPKNTITLKLGERARIPVTITVPENASPGGLYGSVLISTVQVNDKQPAGSTRSPVIARIGTLFFVTVPGEVTKSGETKELALKNNKLWYERGPIDFSVLYENTGSMHLNPYGELRITNLFGEEVGFVELDPWFSLPRSLRTREVKWDRELLFGRYEATVNVNRGYDDIVDTKSVVFWVLPWKIVASVFSIVFIVLFGFRLFFRNFEFKRRT